MNGTWLARVAADWRNCMWVVCNMSDWCNCSSPHWPVIASAIDAVFTRPPMAIVNGLFARSRSSISHDWRRETRRRINAGHPVRGLLD
jgi:hypothetical protein